MQSREISREYRSRPLPEKREGRDESDEAEIRYGKPCSQGNHVAALVGKLKHLSKVLRRWGASKRNPSSREKEDILLQIQVLDQLEEALLMNEDNRQNRTSLQAKYEEILLKEEIYWKQRSRERWIKEGGMIT
ncbi:hypothetical protein Taro_003133 [Colocasia esculenta]|uniref:Uncharacterized protein n=1 Tax=Colocasia esculenta TaxID=4460 RepID=A0A843TIE5_COLES|nr:hypothetical protein [Colocasia esculenta]